MSDEFIRSEKIRKINSFPTVNNGYVMQHVNEHSYKPTEMSKWAFEHKPYACDFPKIKEVD